MSSLLLRCRRVGEVALLPMLAFAVMLGAGPAIAACPDRPPCSGCGCKGGPGYRAPDRHCVGFKELDKVCGNPPTRCTFENAPGTGLNRDCALAPRNRGTRGEGASLPK